jgi:hypothetical protein
MGGPITPKRVGREKPIKKLPIMTAAVAVALSVFPATSSALPPATDALLTATIRKVRVNTDTGTVRVRARYWCDPRYAEAAEPSEHLEEGSNAVIRVGWHRNVIEWMASVVCDGEAHDLVREGPLPTGQALSAYFFVHIDPAEDVTVPYPGDLQAGERKAFGREGTPLPMLAHIKVRRVFVNDRGRLSIHLWYQCAEGWHAGHIATAVAQGDEDWDWGWSIPDDVVCDGQAHRAAFRPNLDPWRPEALDADRPVRVYTYFLAGAADQPTVRAESWITALP